MRITILTTILLFVAVCAFGALSAEIETNQTNINVSLLSDSGDIENPTITKILALPANEAEIQISYMVTEIYDKQGNLLETSNQIDHNRIWLSNKITMRELHAFPVNIKVRQENSNTISIIKSLNFSLNSLEQISLPNSISRVYKPIYETFVDNYETSYLRNLESQTSKILIVSHNDLDDFLSPFIRWKKAKGFEIDVLYKDDLGNTANEIKSGIEDYWNSASLKPEFLILIGDVNSGSSPMPGFYIDSPSGDETDITDLPYTLLEGAEGDYFPEMIGGRISIGSPIDLVKILNKTIKYEKEPIFEGSENDWMEEALVVAGNYAGGGIQPVTPVQMSQWLKSEMLENGITHVDTVFYPPTQPGTADIVQSINDGVQYISYRGWGDASGWHYPEFHISNFDLLSNGYKLPIVTSIVCNTGDYSNSEYEACFGEAWMRMGSPNNPNGCVAFVGPSDLHTSTELNNSISSGLYYGILEENIRNFGAAVLRGKFELFKNYPNDRENGENVEFYFHVYNILSDPSMTMWFGVPNMIQPDVEIGSNYINVDTGYLENGIATATFDDMNYTKANIVNGSAIIPIDADNSGEVTLTISSKNKVPYQETLEYNYAGLTIDDYSFDNEYLCQGQTTNLNITLKNFTNVDVNNISATLNVDNSDISISPTEADFGNIPTGESASANYEITIPSDISRGETVEFSLDISNGDEAKFSSTIGGINLPILTLEVNDSNGILEPGETADIALTVQNSGEVDLTGLAGTITPSTNAVTVNQSELDFGSLPVDETGNATFNATLDSESYPGKIIRFLVDFSTDNGLEYSNYAYLETGIIDNTAPTGTDNYGYYIYDSNDTDYEAAPTYDWMDIDPQNGGEGELMLMWDDVSETIDLPFTFQFYGVEYDEITICSNGWVSMGSTWMRNFRNWDVPAALGPPAMIAANWDDLKGFSENGDDYEQMRVSYYYDSDRFIIEWDEAYNNQDNTNPDYLQKFQVILYDPDIYETPTGDGEIVVHYHTFSNPDDNGNYNTVGIQNWEHDDGLRYTYANNYPGSASEISAEMSIKFTTVKPDNFVSTDEPNDPELLNQLSQNYPNPFFTSNPINSETSIDFAVKKSEKVSIEVFNIRGRKVKTLLDQKIEAGNHTVTWNGTNNNNKTVSSGIYFYKLKVNEKTVNIKKCMLIK